MQSRIQRACGAVARASLLLLALAPAARATTVLSDPVGDVFYFAAPPAGLAIPDLIEITGGYTATELILTATFAPGTLVPLVGSTFFSFGLDLDLDQSTGRDFIRGAEQHVMFHTSLETAFVCSRVLVVPAVCSAEIPVFLTADMLRVVVSLGPDGINDDGLARFGFVAGMLGASGPLSEDIAFDVTSQVERRFTVSTSPIAVPEPSSALGVLVGLAALATGRRARR